MFIFFILTKPKELFLKDSNILPRESWYPLGDSKYGMQFVYHNLTIIVK